MTQIRSYDSFEEMQADMARAEQAAAEAILPRQATITHGDRYLSVAHLNEGLAIFGRIYSLADHIVSAYLGYFPDRNDHRNAVAQVQALVDTAELEHLDTPTARETAQHVGTEAARVLGIELDADQVEEGDYEIDRILTSHHRGYRFGRAYSVVVPEGELGSTHVSVMIPVTEAMFDQAAEAGFAIDGLMQLDWFDKTVRAGAAGGMEAAIQAAEEAANG